MNKPPFLYCNPEFNIEYEVYTHTESSCILVLVADSKKMSYDYILEMPYSVMSYLPHKIDEFEEEEEDTYSLADYKAELLGELLLKRDAMAPPSSLINVKEFVEDFQQVILGDFGSPARCSCEIVSLMQGGCKCGGV